MPLQPQQANSAFCDVALGAAAAPTFVFAATFAAAARHPIRKKKGKPEREKGEGRNEGGKCEEGEGKRRKGKKGEGRKQEGREAHE